MKFLFGIVMVSLLAFSRSELSAQDNPFMRMAGKKYANYYAELNDFYHDITSHRYSGDVQKTVSQLKEVAAKTGSREWQLEADYAELLTGAYMNDNFSQEQRIQSTFNLLKKAQKANVTQVELRLRDHIIDGYANYIQNYELAFEQADIQEKQLQEVTSNDIPEKTMYYLQIANLHYKFRDYANAIVCFERIMGEKDSMFNLWHKFHSLNGLGLIYRYSFNDLDRSDSCFRAISHLKYLNSIGESMRGSWEGIAEGNMGCNMFLRSEYDKAIPLLKSSLEKVLKDNDDYGYPSVPATYLATIYLKKSNTPKAKQYIDVAITTCLKNPKSTERTAPVYEVLSKYYAAIGNATLSMEYMDSTLRENKKNEEQFSALQMMRVEQRKHLSEQKLKDEQLNTEKIKETGYLKIMLITFVGLLALGGILARYLVLYRKKQAAYQELVRKSQEWASTTVKYPLPFHPETEDAIPAGSIEPDAKQSASETDRQLFEQVQILLQNEPLYRNSAVAINDLARRMNVNRTYLSQAINRCTGKNFSTFINEYRIKEAVLLMSSNPKKFSFEGIAFEVGFTDRRIFYTAFMKITGLSPSEFRKNL